MVLPSAIRTIANTRDYCLLDFPIPSVPPSVTRTGVLWDADKDERVLEVLLALHYRDLRVRSTIIAIAETAGTVTGWVSAVRDSAHAIVQGAADAALRPFDRWTVAPLIVIPTRDGVLDRDALPPDHPLHKFSKRFALGTVRP